MGLFDFLKTNKPIEPVALPVIFSNVAYVVFGENSYGGELIVAPDAIYYFPHTNLAPQDRQKEKIIWTGIRDLVRNFWHSELNPDRGVSGSPSVAGSADEKIELLMKYVKENRQDSLLADSIPSPVKFSRDGIQKLRLGWGNLKFDANFDDHEFRGLNGSILQRSLKSGGYIS